MQCCDRVDYPGLVCCHSHFDTYVGLPSQLSGHFVSHNPSLLNFNPLTFPSLLAVLQAKYLCRLVCVVLLAGRIRDNL